MNRQGSPVNPRPRRIKAGWYALWHKRIYEISAIDKDGVLHLRSSDTDDCPVGRIADFLSPQDGSSSAIFAPTPQELEKEYERRVASNDFASASKSYVYSDRNVQIQVEFSSMPPLVIVPDRKYYVYFTIRNIGQGFLGDINPGDLVFRSTDSRAPIDFLRCQYPTAVLPITEKSSPKIACEIIAPGDYFTTRNFGTGSFVIELNYKYELRRDLSVDIVK